MSYVLVVDDERDIRELISEILRDEGFETRTAADADGALAEIEREAPALVILDIWLKDSRMDGIDVLKRIRRDNPEVPVVIISGHGNIEIAVAAIKRGAYDFIEKPFNIDHLLVVVNRAMETSRLRRENAELREQGAGLPELIGNAPAFRAFRAELERVAPTNARVLLTGPSGSGKEHAARWIHAHGSRARGPFVAVSCGSLDDERVEALLFGCEGDEGDSLPGLFEKAHGGTLFLDEVADLPAEAQARLLRTLVEQQFRRSGGAASVRVDVRVIAATSRDLAAAVAEGRFREDLYHRLAVVPLEVPPLAARREDIVPLARHFIARFHETQNLPLRELADDAAAALEARPWPGNVRELRNLVERLLILGEADQPITAAEIEARGAAAGGDEAPGQPALDPQFLALPLRQARETFERAYLAAQIERFGGNVSRTASFVGMERSALHRKLKLLGLAGQGARERAGAGDAAH